MAAALVPDTLWGLIEPLLPIRLPKPQGGRPRLTDRACLAGIIFVLRSLSARARRAPETTNPARPARRGEGSAPEPVRKGAVLRAEIEREILGAVTCVKSCYRQSGSLRLRKAG